MTEPRVAITGANGHLGLRVLERFTDARAIVRSAVAGRHIAATRTGVDVQILDYTDTSALTRALGGFGAVVHLVGILKESANSRYQQAHEDATRSLVEAAHSAGVERIVYLSILGAHPGSSNACLASKARAETILLDGPVPAVVLQVPMVLGEGDHASRSLAAQARSKVAFTFRASSLEQPIYAGDVIDAILAGLRLEQIGGMRFLLAGPESLSRRQLIERAAALLDVRPHIVSLPRALGMALAFVMEKSSANPPLTRAMLGVLDHDDDVDSTAAAQRLGVVLTPLDEMLRRVLL